MVGGSGVILAPTDDVLLISRHTLGCLYLAAEPGLERLAADGLPAPVAIREAVGEARRLLTATAVAEIGRPESDDEPQSDLMTATEAATRVGRSERTIGRWASSGRLPAARQARPGSPWVVSLRECQEAAHG